MYLYINVNERPLQFSLNFHTSYLSRVNNSYVFVTLCDKYERMHHRIITYLSHVLHFVFDIDFIGSMDTYLSQLKYP